MVPSSNSISPWHVIQFFQHIVNFFFEFESFVFLDIDDIRKDRDFGFLIRGFIFR